MFGDANLQIEKAYAAVRKAHDDIAFLGFTKDRLATEVKAKTDLDYLL